MLSVLPGIELRIGRNTDDNDFLVHNDWFSYSALISKNLIQIVSAPSKIRLARSGLQVAETRRLATGMAVLAQVRVAHHDFEASEDALRFAERARKVEGRAYEVTQERVAGESQTELELIRRTANRLVAEMDYHRAYSHLQESYGRLVNSVGVLPPLSEADVADVSLLGERIRAALEHWGRRAPISDSQHAQARGPRPLQRGSGDQ
jgi:outer membrane protein TolC